MDIARTSWIRLAALLVLATAAGQADAQTVQLAARTNTGTGTFTYAMNSLDDDSDTITTSAAGVVTTSGQISDVTSTGAPVTITQAANPQYTLTSAACADPANGTSNVGALVGNTLTIAPANFVAGAALLCTFENALIEPDLAVTKAANVTGVASGGTVEYTLVASNVGTQAVTNAVLSDVAGTGLSCTAPATCVPSSGATCPGSLPAGDLFGAGVTIPSLDAGSNVTVTVSCTVTASGQ